MAPKGKFNSFFILKPDGNLYLAQHFNGQLEVKISNFADRPYFIEAVQTKKR